MTGPAPEVTVVGAGPTGMTLAALLGAAGRRVRVLERRPGPVDQPRAVHLDHQAAWILDAAGVMADLAPHTVVMDAYEWRSAAGEVLLRLQPDGPVGRCGWPESSMFSQPRLEALLAARLAALDPVELRWGSEVADLDDLGDGWVVGCDGARSTVRSLAGIGVEDAGYGYDWLVVDVVEHRPRRWEPCNVQVCDPARPTTAVSGGPGRRRFEFMRLPGEDVASLATGAAAWRLLAAWELHPGNATLERHAVYRFEARLAERWRAGRVLLAGDAAHQMPPFAGQGLCAGLRDAANLAWKLQAVLAGAAPEALLDTYGSERAAQTRVEIDFSVELGKLVCVTDPEAAAARDAELIAAAAAAAPVPPPPLPPLGPGLLLAGDPAAGSLAVQEPGCLPTWELRGRDGDPGAHLGPAQQGLLDRLGGRAVDGSSGLPRTARWLAELGAAAVLVRPDGATYGTVSELAAAGGLLDALGRHLRGR